MAVPQYALTMGTMVGELEKWCEFAETRRGKLISAAERPLPFPTVGYAYVWLIMECFFGNSPKKEESGNNS